MATSGEDSTHVNDFDAIEPGAIPGGYPLPTETSGEQEGKADDVSVPIPGAEETQQALDRENEEKKHHARERAEREMRALTGYIIAVLANVILAVVTVISLGFASSWLARVNDGSFDGCDYRCRDGSDPSCVDDSAPSYIAKESTCIIVMICVSFALVLVEYARQRGVLCRRCEYEHDQSWRNRCVWCCQWVSDVSITMVIVVVCIAFVFAALASGQDVNNNSTLVCDPPRVGVPDQGLVIVMLMLAVCANAYAAFLATRIRARRLTCREMFN